tara:strand:- start:439 stop:849 length:411 start_codon:yes stop_codon:yes gene_type:complete
MNKEILIVGSKYYNDIYQNLLKGSIKTLENYKFNYQIREAPGSLEIPFIINKYINNFSGFVALGCIIRGETYHFDLIANESSRKIMDLSINYKKPIGLGILTCNTYEQALVRSDPNQKNKGKEATEACIKLLADEN